MKLCCNLPYSNHHGHLVGGSCGRRERGRRLSRGGREEEELAEEGEKEKKWSIKFEGNKEDMEYTA